MRADVASVELQADRQPGEEEPPPPNICLSDLGRTLSSSDDPASEQSQWPSNRRVGLAQLIRFLMVELIYSDSNPKFNKGVVFTINYSFNGR
jgi:hypothetical protein